MSRSFAQIISELPASRRKDLKTLRGLLRKHKPREIVETLEGDQLVYTLPRRYFPESYNGRPLLYATLSNRKSYISLNLIAIHNDRMYRAAFAKKILRTGACAKATGCCYQIKTVNSELSALLKKDLSSYGREKFVATFAKYRQK